MRALKSHYMKANFTQQEILLMTGTSFSQHQWCKNDEPEDPHQLSEKEQLVEACWNGLLKDMLPEIYEQPANGEKLYLWQVKEAGSFLEIELGQLSAETENYFSIDPYSFMTTKEYN